MSIVHEGTLKGAFKGFKNRDTVFEFADGRKWKQNEYKYHYHYAYRPTARIIEKSGCFVLHVEGMSDTVQVVKIH